MLQLENVAYTYGTVSGPARTPALHGVSGHIPAGSFTLLTGPSGAGKTTLFKLLTLSLLPTSGTLRINGTNVGTASRSQRAALRRSMGIVFQDFRLQPHLSVWANAALPLQLQGPLTVAASQHVYDMLAWVGLDHLAEQPVSQLSGGEQQRVALARAVVHQPKLVLADEPTGNLDAAMRKRIWHLLTSLHQHGTTVVVATHDEALLRNPPGPVWHLHGGTLASETPSI